MGERPYDHLTDGGHKAEVYAKGLVEHHGKAFGMAIAIEMLRQIIPDEHELETLTEEWEARFL